MTIEGVNDLAPAAGPAVVLLLAGAAAAPAWVRALPKTWPVYLGRLADQRAPGKPAEIVSRALHEAFLGRRLVLVGAGDEAETAAMSHGPEILRAVVIDPTLQNRRGEDIRHAYGSRRIPVDAVLSPESSLSAEDRAWLGAQQSTTVVQWGRGSDPKAIVSALRAALSFAGGLRRDSETLAGWLAAAAPRTARRVTFSGPALAAFATAYRRFNPGVETVAASGQCDVLALVTDGARTPDLDTLLAQLEPGGSVVALAPLGDGGRRLEAELISRGLTPSSADARLTPLGARLVRARKGPAGPTARIELVTYAPLGMDIRTTLPTDGLRTDLDLELDLHDPPFWARQDEPRIVILQKAPAGAPAEWHAVAARAILAGQVLVMEYDDHPDLISLMNRDRLTTAEEWERFRVVHAVQTTEAVLAAAFREHNPEVRAFRNCVFELPPYPERARPMRVFYGALTRGPFAVDVARALTPAIEAFPQAEFHVVGDRDVFEALPTARKRFDKRMPYERYLAAMAECCISLSPLPPEALVATKSDAKYLDAARAGVVTIASSTLYDRVIRHGENGLLAHSLADWPRLLTQALADPEGLRRMGRAAWEDVRNGRLFSQQIGPRRDWYLDLLSRREDLNAALLQRSPAVAQLLEALRGGTR